jgi:hypothetical protein
MVMTDEIIAQMEAQRVNEEARREHEKVMEASRAKLELLRMAKDTLVENARNKPAEETAITAVQITAFAEELTQYVGG